ncbi:MAG: tRNA lysidine(34) synthetase TilS [Vigna little leaf phytoplasma]|nr:tRNA lysidine(34) synthetase TilS [Vigna little leaf phytoplasma]
MKINLSVKLNHKNIYIISVSGGVDSMVLLDFLYHRNFFLVVVYFDHCKREESFKDKILVEMYCQMKKIPFHFFQFKNISLDNFHNNARIMRQFKLKQVALQYNTKYIITAHHLDDLAETIFMKILRGSSLIGYSGMQPVYTFENFIWLKPFLYLEKKIIKKYAQQNKIPFLEDKTNLLSIYTRNKIRNQIIPIFQQTRNFLKKIKHFHLQLKEVSDLINNAVNLFMETQKKNNFSLTNFLQLHITIQKNIILFLLETNKITKNFIIINNIVKGLSDTKKPNIQWRLDNRWKLTKEYDKFFLQKINFTTTSNTRFYNKNKPLLYSCSDPQLLPFCENKQKIFYDKNNYHPPFYLRKRKPGDILFFAFGKQKLKKFLINKKITRDQRDSIWLIVDQTDTIIWIPNLYINKMLGNKEIFYLCLK